ncbi:MAG: neutral zinc metallopeptidase [Acidimicrobiales bacterium]
MSVRALGRCVLVAATVAIVAGCGVAADVANRDRILLAGDDATPTTVGRAIDEVEDRFNGDGIGDDDEVILAALQDVEAYWDNEFPEVFGGDFEPVDAFFAYGPDTESPPCGSPPPPYQAIAGNAFYCPGTDIIAWDTTQLIPGIQDQFGDFALGIVMAHEYGHALQARTDFDGLTIAFEQQADCYAGAWAQWVRRGNAENFEIRFEDLDSSLAGFLELRDSPNTSLLDPGAHGTAFDRVSAFQDGFFNGAEKCAEYSNADLPAVPLEQFREGFLTDEPDAAFNRVEGFTVEDLDNFWTAVFDELGEEWDPPEALPLDPSAPDQPSCGGDQLDGDDVEGEALYCEADDFVAWDEAELMPELYRDIGDFAMATVIGTQYSQAALAKLGDDADDLETALRADCLTGAWIASAVIQDRGPASENELGNVFVLTPGDLDEVIESFLTQGDAFTQLDAELGEPGTPFVRLGALRRGFFESLEEGSSVAGVTDCLENFLAD